MMNENSDKIKKDVATILISLWITLIVLCFILSASIFSIVLWISNFWFALGSMILFLAILSAYFFKVSWQQVPQNEEWRVTLFGDDIGTPWKSGLHFLFPYFTEISGKVYMGTQRILLVLKGKEESAREELSDFEGHLEFKGLLEFTDCSAGALLTIFYRITDSFKAVYDVDFLPQSVADVIDGAIRSALSGLSVDEASEKTSIEIKDGYKKNEENIEGIIPRTKKLLKDWGVEIIDLKLDIVLPKEIMEQRMKTIEAERDAKVTCLTADATAYRKEKEAEGERMAIETIAKGEKSARRFRGEGRASEIVKIKKETDLSSQEAAEHARRLDFIEAMPTKTLIMGADSENIAGLGAKIGASATIAQQIVQEPKKETGRMNDGNDKLHTKTKNR